MPIETICQGCSKKLRVADEHAGKQARCPGCGNIYIVPQPTPSSYSPAPLETPLGSAPLPSAAAKTEPTSAPASTPEPASTRFGSDSTSASSAFSASSVYANPPAKDVSERWFMKIDDGREFGPVDRPTLDQWYRERRIGASTQLKREYDAQWQPASAVYPSLTGATAGRTTASSAGHSANPFSDQAVYGNAGPYASPGMPTSYVEPHRGGLILAFALIGWMFCILFGVAAWVMAAGDLKKMRAGQMDNSGYGLTQAGMIIAIIQMVLVAVGFAFFFLLVLIGAANG